MFDNPASGRSNGGLMARVCVKMGDDKVMPVVLEAVDWVGDRMWDRQVVQPVCSSDVRFQAR